MDMSLEKNVLIAESNGLQRKRIIEAVYAAAMELNVKVKIYRAVNTIRAAKILEQNDIDMLILNTVYQKMPNKELPGIRLVEWLRTVQKYSLLPVIFVSPDMEQRKYVFKELNCIGCQPFAFKDEVLEKILKKGLHYTTCRDAEKEVWLRSQTKLYPVRVKDILYIASGNREVKFFMRNGSLVEVAYRTLVDVKKKLESRYLLQCERGIIVNTAYIDRIEEKTIFLSAEDKEIGLNIGTSYKSAVEMAMMQKEILS